MNAAPIQTLGALLRASAAARPDADALVFPTERLSHAELNRRAIEWAKALVALGVQPGEHVGLLLPTCTQFVEALFGIAMAGAVAVPINARYQAGELAYLIENADLVALISTDRIADAVNFVERISKALPSLAGQRGDTRLACPEAPKLRNLILIGDRTPPGFMSAESALAQGAKVADGEIEARIDAVDPESVGLVLYTSGTTSNPKGCLITHRGMVGNSRNLGRRYGLTADDRFWSPLPIFHIAGILPMVAVIDVAGAYLTIPSFDAGVALDMLEREKATTAYPCFVTIMQDLIAHEKFKTTDLSRIRLMNSNFAVQPAWIKEAMREAMPHTIQVGTYGLTEGAGTICTSRPDDSYELRTGRLGVPLDEWEVRILDPETGKESAPGAHGEIVARGPNMLKGYYKDPVKTAETIDAEGWMHTGDLGSIDGSGHIMFHGRLKDMLKVGGENVAAAEIEALLNTHPAVQLSQVVGAPHPRYVEVPAAFIELKPGQSATAEELIAFCDGKLARFKTPRHIRFVTEWPMSTSKIQKFRLRDRLAAELGDAAA